MRLECANRDEKTGVILREGGDDHDLVFWTSKAAFQMGTFGVDNTEDICL